MFYFFVINSFIAFSFITMYYMNNQLVNARKNQNTHAIFLDTLYKIQNI